MFEGSTFNSDQEQPAEVPFDYVAEAKRLREEREAKEKEEKAKKEAETKKKKLASEKAKKSHANSSDKAKDVTKKAEELQEKVEEAKQEVEEAKQELQDAPVEMNVSEGSEYVANLENGEEATLHFNHEDLADAVEQVTDTIEDASEEAERASAIARAREAINMVTKEDIPEELGGHESSLIYDLGEESAQVRDRLKSAWDSTRAEDSAEQVDVNRALFEDIQAEASGANSQTAYEGIDTSTSYSSSDGSIERAPDRTSPITSTVKSGIAYVSGYVTSRSRGASLARTLRQTQKSLQHEIASLRKDVSSLQETSPIQETQVNNLASIETTQVQRVVEIAKPEVSIENGQSTAVTPDWIKSLEYALKNGSLLELKKWQLDILKSQYPELLKRLQLLESKNAEKAVEKKTESMKDQKSLIEKAEPDKVRPGELPAPLGVRPISPRPMTPTYALSADTSYAYSQASSSSIQGYVTASLVGGIIFGLILIFAFGF